MKTGLKLMIQSVLVFMTACLFFACTAKQTKLKQLSITETDKYYSAMSEKQGMNAAFLAMFDSAGVILRDNRMPVEGINAISKLLLSKSDSAFSLTWQPLMSRVASSGDLGYTYGTYQINMKPAGTLAGTGTYVTIWKRLPDGKWKALLDTGNEGLDGQIK